MKSKNLYEKVDHVLKLPVVKVGIVSGQNVLAGVDILKLAMAVRGKANAQAELADGHLLASFEGDLQEVFRLETSWSAIKNAASVQHQWLESTLGKREPPPDRAACAARFDEAKLSELFCNVVCGGSVVPSAPSKCKRSLESDSQAKTFEIQAQEVKKQLCDDWATFVPTLDDAEKARTWIRYVDVAVAKANKLLSKSFTSPYSLALDSQQHLVTWTKKAYDLCVADSKWYNNPLGSITNRARGWRRGQPPIEPEVGAEGNSSSQPQHTPHKIIEEKVTQLKNFIHDVTCPVVDSAIREAASFRPSLSGDFLDGVLFEDFQRQYLLDLRSFYKSIAPVCKNANSGFVSRAARVMSLVFDGLTIAGLPSGIPAGLATAAIMWHGVGQGNYSQLVQPQNIAVVVGALRSFSYLAKRASDGYLTGSQSCRRIAEAGLGIEIETPGTKKASAAGMSEICS